MRRILRSALTVLIVAIVCPSAAASTLPAGFLETLVAPGLIAPTAMDFAPDGRLFVCQQGGKVRVIKNGILLATPFVELSVLSTGEHGLLGIAFDPDFAVNRFVYVYYTTTASRNRISRFTADGDVVAIGSETIIFELDEPTAGNHNGGAIHFGADGKLYAAIGDYGTGSNAQALTTLPGKMLRINKDGTIPADNPFFGVTSGKNRAIWALGLRNPFTFGVHRTSGRIFINDVGSTSFEEINDGIAGSNYGWPNSEGPTNDLGVRAPLFSYARGGAEGNCAIVGGAFYTPVTQQFPADYAGDYFFADLCGGRIKRYKPSMAAVTEFSSGALQIVDIKTAADGSLYYLSRGKEAVYRIEYQSSLPAGRFAIAHGENGRAFTHVMGGPEAGYEPIAEWLLPWPAYTDLHSPHRGVRAAAGDVDGDGLDEIVLGLERYGNGWIAIFDDAAHDYALLKWVQVPWDAYNAANGEVFPAVGNLDGDPGEEIVAGLGSGSLGWYAIIDDSSTDYAFITWRQLPWDAYNNANGTIHPAIGDIDGDDHPEVILGLGAGGGGWMLVAGGASNGFAPRRWLRVHWAEYNAGHGATWPAAGDVDDDGRDEIVVGLGEGANGYFEIIDDAATGFAAKAWVRVDWPRYNAKTGETHPAVGNIDGDAAAEIVIGFAGANSEVGGWVVLFDDWSTATALIGWRNGFGQAQGAPMNAPTFPAIGRMR